MIKIGVNARFLELPTTGIGVMLRGYLEELGKIEDVKLVLFLTKEVEMALPQNTEIRVVPEKGWGGSWVKSWWEARLLPEAAWQERCDVFWSPYPSVSQMRMRHVMTVHDTIPWTDKRYARLRTKLYYRQVRKNLEKVQAIHFVSEAGKDDFERIFAGNEVYKKVIHNAVRMPDENELGRVNLRRPYLLYLGGFDPRKNVEKLVRDWAEVVEPRLGIDLVLAGQPPRENRLAKSPLAVVGELPEEQRAKIHLTGKISEAEKFALYRKAVGFVHYSEAEGFNLPLLEAMMTGCACAVSDLAVHREVAGDGAMYLPLGNELERQERLVKFVRDEELRAKLSWAGQKRAGKFSWGKSTAEMVRLWQEVREK